MRTNRKNMLLSNDHRDRSKRNTFVYHRLSIVTIVNDPKCHSEFYIYYS